MQINIKNTLIDELCELDCVKRYLVDAEGNPIIPTAPEKQEAVKKFVHEELKSRLIQRREEIAKAQVVVDRDITIE